MEGCPTTDAALPTLLLVQVNLYWDLPQPSHSSHHEGMVPQGTQVLSFTIPQPRSAQWWPGPAKDCQANSVSGELGQGGMARGSPVPGLLYWGLLVHPGENQGKELGQALLLSLEAQEELLGKDPWPWGGPALSPNLVGWIPLQPKLSERPGL